MAGQNRLKKDKDPMGRGPFSLTLLCERYDSNSLAVRHSMGE